MSTPKKELPEPAPKKAAPKKAVKKKVVKPVPTPEDDDEIVDAVINQRAERIASPEPVTTLSHTLTPAATVVTTTEEYQPPKIEELHEQYGVKDISHQVEEEVKERATGVWSKTKTLWGKYGWIPVVAVLLIAVIFGYLYFARDKRDKSEKQTQQTEQKIEDGKARLSDPVYNITANALKTVDSAISIRIKDINILWEERNRIMENEKEKNAQSKLRSDENKKNILAADTAELNRRARN